MLRCPLFGTVSVGQRNTFTSVADVGTSREGLHLDGGDVLPGLALSLRELFADPLSDGPAPDAPAPT